MSGALLAVALPPIQVALGVIAASLGIMLAIPPSKKWSRWTGAALAAVGFGLMVAALPAAARDLVGLIAYYSLAIVTVGSALATISMRSAVYAAVFFALTLLGVAGLFLYQGAQFLGVATIVVYAGAILVTFLFVLMLAQPEGHSLYDRISWGWAPKPLSAVVSAAILSAGFAAFGRYADAGATDEARAEEILNPQHMTHLSSELFGRHVVGVELAGTLLLAALVGAIAIVIHGKTGASREDDER